MKRKNSIYVLLLILILILILLILLSILNTNSIEGFVEQDETKYGYLLPILRINYTPNDYQTHVNTDKPIAIISTGDRMPDNNTKPYIFINDEATLYYDKPRKHVDENYKTAVEDKNCVACFITRDEKLYKSDKIFYLPLIVFRGNFNFTSSPLKREYTNNQRNLLAAYIATHSPKHRDDFFKILRSKDSTVEGLGAANNTRKVTLPDRKYWWDLSKIYKDYKFGLAMENSNEDGYITEKIMNVYIGGAIPIYWGTSKIKEIFNQDSFIYVNDYSSFDECANDIIAIGKDPIRLKRMQNAPIFVENSKYSTYYDIPAKEWVLEIANKIKNNIDKVNKRV